MQLPAAVGDMSNDSLYRGVVDPLELMQLIVSDYRLPLLVRAQWALNLAPYLYARLGPKPYLMTEDERRVLEDQERLTVNVRDFKENYEVD